MPAFEYRWGRKERNVVEKELKLSACDENMRTVLEQVEQMLEQTSCDEMTQMQIVMAAEELFVNIAHYAYGGEPGEAVLTMKVMQEPERFHMTFRDRGIPYNPLEHKDPDITLPAEEREIGGLGIFLIKKTMDKMEYEYRDGWNVLSIEKRLAE